MDPNELRIPKEIMSGFKLENKKEAYEEILDVVKFFW